MAAHPAFAPRPAPELTEPARDLADPLQEKAGPGRLKGVCQVFIQRKRGDSFPKKMEHTRSVRG